MRILAVGNQELMDGFTLLGIETFINPDKGQLEKLLNDVQISGDRVLIYLQQDLLDFQLPVLDQLRREGGNVLISEVPCLHAPGNRQASIDQLITRTIGAAALEPSHG